MAFATDQPNISAAFVVARKGLSDPKVEVLVVVVAILCLVMLSSLSGAPASRVSAPSA